jgi:hypothetical protein
MEDPMTVKVRFMQSGQFNSGEFKSLDLSKISKLQINHLRNSCELLATSSENPRPDTPYIIAARDNQHEIQAIMNDLQQLRSEKKDIIYEITGTEAHRVSV